MLFCTKTILIKYFILHKEHGRKCHDDRIEKVFEICH